MSFNNKKQELTDLTNELLSRINIYEVIIKTHVQPVYHPICMKPSMNYRSQISNQHNPQVPIVAGTVPATIQPIPPNSNSIFINAAVGGNVAVGGMGGSSYFPIGEEIIIPTPHEKYNTHFTGCRYRDSYLTVDEHESIVDDLNQETRDKDNQIKNLQKEVDSLNSEIDNLCSLMGDQ